MNKVVRFVKIVKSTTVRSIFKLEKVNNWRRCGMFRVLVDWMS